MTESMLVEAVRNVSTATAPAQVAGGPQGPTSAADPAAVARFQAAMGVQDANGPDPIPFASEATASIATRRLARKARGT